MAEEIPTVGDLGRRSEVADAEYDAVSGAYIKDEGTPPFEFEFGHKVNAAMAIDIHAPVKKLLAYKPRSAGMRFTRVRTAISLGLPLPK